MLSPRRASVLVLTLTTFLLTTGRTQAADKPAVSVTSLLGRPDDWLKSDAARPLLDNVVTYQHESGGWCKGYDPTRPRDPAAGRDGFGGWNGCPTIDNDATVTEIRLMARAFAATSREEYRAAAVKGITFLLDRQYPNGGWPQRSPKDGKAGYGAHITFNDNAMTNVMELLRDVAAGTPSFRFADETLRTKAKAAFDRGVDCILRCQIVVKGEPTGWCQQHDETTLAPASARAYELPSISGAESAKITRLLMRIETPDERTRKAVAGAHAWFERSKIVGKRIELADAAGDVKGKDKKLIDDPTAPPMWARYYDLETNRPFFCSRDGVKRFDISEISYERRNGYAWYGSWGSDVLKEFAHWEKRTAK